MRPSQKDKTTYKTEEVHSLLDADIMKINQILTAKKMVLRHDLFPLNQDQKDFIGTLIELCRAIVEYGNSWLVALNQYSTSVPIKWPELELSKTSIDNLSNKLPKVVITNNRIGIALTKLNFSAAFCEMISRGVIDWGYINKLTSEITDVERMTPVTVLADYTLITDKARAELIRNAYQRASVVKDDAFNLNNLIDTVKKMGIDFKDRCPITLVKFVVKCIEDSITLANVSIEMLELTLELSKIKSSLLTEEKMQIYINKIYNKSNTHPLNILPTSVIDEIIDRVGDNKANTRRNLALASTVQFKAFTNMARATQALNCIEARDVEYLVRAAKTVPNALFCTVNAVNHQSCVGLKYRYTSPIQEILRSGDIKMLTKVIPLLNGLDRTKKMLKKEFFVVYQDTKERESIASTDRIMREALKEDIRHKKAKMFNFDDIAASILSLKNKVVIDILNNEDKQSILSQPLEKFRDDFEQAILSDNRSMIIFHLIGACNKLEEKAFWADTTIPEKRKLFLLHVANFIVLHLPKCDKELCKDGDFKLFEPCEPPQQYEIPSRISIVGKSRRMLEDIISKKYEQFANVMQQSPDYSPQTDDTFHSLIYKL